jgi:DHA1 family bicyclomycin/chloramphenicol resistance-like MFS transporter
LLSNSPPHTKEQPLNPAQRNNLIIILILGALSTITPLAIDMYLPAIPQIAHDLGTNPARVSMSIASYFIGLGAGQLFYGPILDRYGRKRPLYAGLLLYVFAAIGCVAANTVEVLIALRLLQGLGGCVAQVDAIAMVRDFFPVEESSRIISMLILILGVSPLLAPTVGSLVAATLGWHWIFLLLAIVAVAMMLIVFRYLPEGHQPDPGISLKPQRIAANFLAILEDAQFRTYALAGAFSFCGLFVYVAGSPIIFMDVFHVSTRMYGGIFALLSVGFIGGNQVNIWLSRRYHDQQLFRIALYCQTVVAIVFQVAVLNGVGLTGTMVLLLLYLSCLGLTYPNAAAIAMAPFSRNAGSASALLGFLQLGIGALASAGVGLLNSSSNVPIVSLMCGTTLIGLVIFQFGQGRAGRQRHQIS